MREAQANGGRARASEDENRPPVRSSLSHSERPRASRDRPSRTILLINPRSPSCDSPHSPSSSSPPSLKTPLPKPSTKSSRISPSRGVLNNGKQISYALGLEISSYRGLPIVEHGGALFGYRTEILRFPDQRFSILCLCNLAGASPGRLARQVADVYLAKDLQPIPQPPALPADATVSTPNQFAGKYFDRRNHSLLTFTLSENTLVDGRTHLKRTAPNKFAYPGGGPVVTFENVDGVVKASVESNGETTWTGSRMENFQPTAAALSSYTGDYQSSELDATYKLSLDQGSLMLSVNWNPPVKLTPIVANEFEAGELGTLVFHNDSNNHISGLSVFAGRIRHVIFQKTN